MSQEQLEKHKELRLVHKTLRNHFKNQETSLTIDAAMALFTRNLGLPISEEEEELLSPNLINHYLKPEG